MSCRRHSARLVLSWWPGLRAARRAGPLLRRAGARRAQPSRYFSANQPLMTRRLAQRMPIQLPQIELAHSSTRGNDAGLTGTQWLSCSRRAFSIRRSKGGIIDERLGGKGWPIVDGRAQATKRIRQRGRQKVWHSRRQRRSSKKPSPLRSFIIYRPASPRNDLLVVRFHTDNSSTGKILVLADCNRKPVNSQRHGSGCCTQSHW